MTNSANFKITCACTIEREKDVESVQARSNELPWEIAVPFIVRLVKARRAVIFRPDQRFKFKMHNLHPVIMIYFVIFALAACAPTTTSSDPRWQANQQRGFFERLLDEVTERECNVGRFTCSYGLGPADEPCDCTDPSGVVLKGRTVK